jgi:hypothetical protein
MMPIILYSSQSDYEIALTWLNSYKKNTLLLGRSRVEEE